MTARITPSILNADFARMGEEVTAIPSADGIHIDVMDYHFVPNLTMGLPMVESLRKVTTTPFDIHLMISDPDTWAPSYVEAGAESVTFHLEAAKAPVRLAREIRGIMTVEPGFGGQSFLDVVLPKIRRTRQLIDATGADIWLQIDGGVSVETIGRAAEAGADTFVAGSAVYSSDDPDAMVRELRMLAEQRQH